MWPVISILLVTVCLSSPTRAAVLHVSPDGRPGAPGTAQRPIASVQEALDRARPGDTVRVHRGVYRERVAFLRGGEHGKPV
ncbi:MAG: hypothetical protein QHJ73_20150, partial [Armatimonadota bacterium]|nr:hypothetical protein [Armatimonadota bacterium]